MIAAKVMDVIARLPDCDGQAADAVSAYTQVKLKDAPRLLEIPKSECPDVWIRLPRQMDEIMGKHSRSCGSSRTKSVRTPTRWSLVGKTVRRSSIGNWMEKRTELGMPVCESKTMIILMGFRG